MGSALLEQLGLNKGPPDQILEIWDPASSKSRMARSQISWILHPPGAIFPSLTSTRSPIPSSGAQGTGTLRPSSSPLPSPMGSTEVPKAFPLPVLGWEGWLWLSPSPEISAGLWLSVAGKAAENRPALCKNGNCVVNEKCFLWVGCLCFPWLVSGRSVHSTCPGQWGSVCCTPQPLELLEWEEVGEEPRGSPSHS